MSIWNEIKAIFSKPELPAPLLAGTADTKAEPEPLSDKDLATQKGEPWVTVIKVDIDKANIGAGAFELDWNDIFVARLIKAGYKGKVDSDVVDQWFTDVCRNVVMETFEQEMADPETRESFSRTLGDGRKEFR